MTSDTRTERAVRWRIVRWIVWAGGWEAHRHGRWTLRERLGMLTPVALLGHRVVFFGWGVQWRVKGGYWVKSRSGVYWSPDGTPDRAAVWLSGGGGQ